MPIYNQLKNIPLVNICQVNFVNSLCVTRIYLSCCHFKVQVTWPSQTKVCKFKAELELRGRCLLRSTWIDIARAGFTVKYLRTEFCKLFLREISKEFSDIASVKNPSLHC